MPFSSGTFSLYTPGNPVVTGTTIASTWANNTLNDIATGLSTAVLKDGSQTITANLPMSGFKFTGLGAGAASADSANINNVVNATGSLLTGVAGTNTITAGALASFSYTSGQRIILIPAITNTGATTLNVTPSGGSALGAKNIFANGFACNGGELVANVPVVLIYDGTQFNIVGNTASTGTHATTFTWNGGGSTSASKSLSWRKTGSFVALNIPQTNPATGTNSTTLTGDTALPAIIRPFSTQILPCNTVLNNGLAVAEPGVIQIFATGVITFNRNYALTAFTNSANAGIDQAITFTYCLA